MPKSFYNPAPLMSHNAVFNFVCGARGLGKTYAFKKIAIRDAIKKGEEFIYLRRYKSELTAAKMTFFADVGKEFPAHEFRVNGLSAEMRKRVIQRPDETEKEFIAREKKTKYYLIGYFVALSQAQTWKGGSVPTVTKILFDEFIVEKGTTQYLPEEHIVLTNFYSSVDRYQDRTKVFFLANSVSIMNPYFLKYEIRPDQEKEFVKRESGFILAHFPDSSRFQSEVYATRFGRFIEGTEYADYAVGNDFADNNEALIAAKDSNAKYVFTLETKQGQFSVWRLETREYFIQEKRPRSDELLFTLLPEKMDIDKQLMGFNDKPLQILRGAFNRGRVLFNRPSTRNAFAEIFKR